MDNTINNKYSRFTKNAFGTVLIILALLTIISAVLLTIRLIDYIKIDDREVLLQSNIKTDLELFSAKYENESGEISVSGTDGQAVVAPGTSVEYTIRLRNKDKVALDYKLIPTAKYTSEHSVPVMFRMLDDDGKYIIGDAKTWATVDQIANVSDSKTLVKGESTEYVFQWKWDFESGNDEYDTFLGSIAKDENVGLSVNIQLIAEANTDIGTNGGVMKSGLGDIIFAGIAFSLLIVAIVLMILMAKKKKNPVPIDVEQVVEDLTKE
ncbi:MAG: hypothetical protein IJD67_05285 [Clostridia bacterium]|nr:hypothetical protein [Clostridia bacterium]